MKVQQGEKHKQVELRATCAACNLPIRHNTKGSITSWLFGARCTCKSHGSGTQTALEDASGIDTNVDSDGGQEHAAESHPNLGEQYEVLEFLKEGGMGRVYKVRDRKLNVILAIKVLRKELQLEKGALKRFEQEVSILQKLTHINIAPVYGVGTTDNGVPFVAMEYLDGESLEDVLVREKHLSVERTFDLAIQICEALSHAHAKGVVHRDLKPSNIIITKTGSGAEIAHIIDFGVARLQAVDVRQSQNLTRTGDVFGSPMYMSPEQCLGIAQDERSDVYSLGCILFEMITGNPPFQGSNAVQTIVQHLNESPTWKAGNADVQAIVNKCLQKVPDDRYQSVEELQRDLSSIQTGVPVQKRIGKPKVLSWQKPLLIAVFIMAYTAFGISAWNFTTNINQASQSQLRMANIEGLVHKIEKETQALEYATVAFPVMDKESKNKWKGAYQALASEVQDDCSYLIKTATADSTTVSKNELADTSAEYSRRARMVSEEGWVIYKKPNEIEYKLSEHFDNASPVKETKEEASKPESIEGIDSITGPEDAEYQARKRIISQSRSMRGEADHDAFTSLMREMARWNEPSARAFVVYKSVGLDELNRELVRLGDLIRAKSRDIYNLERQEVDSSISPKSLKESMAVSCLLFLFLHLSALVCYVLRLKKHR